LKIATAVPPSASLPFLLQYRAKEGFAMSRMFAKFMVWRYRWFVVAAAVALLVIAYEHSWFLSVFTAPSPHSMEGVFTRVRVGMDREEAMKVLDSYIGAIDSAGTSGTLKDGRRFHEIGWDNLPAAEETAQCTLSLMDEYGEGVEVVVGSDGRVFAKRYSSDLFLDEWRVAVRCYLNGRNHAGRH
jgi:hypothetical protein